MNTVGMRQRRMEATKRSAEQLTTSYYDSTITASPYVSFTTRLQIDLLPIAILFPMQLTILHILFALSVYNEPLKLSPSAPIPRGHSIAGSFGGGSIPDHHQLALLGY